MRVNYDSYCHFAQLLDLELTFDQSHLANLRATDFRVLIAFFLFRLQSSAYATGVDLLSLSKNLLICLVQHIKASICAWVDCDCFMMFSIGFAEAPLMITKIFILQFSSLA
jgi:hypothetical protein